MNQALRFAGSGRYHEPIGPVIGGVESGLADESGYAKQQVPLAQDQLPHVSRGTGCQVVRRLFRRQRLTGLSRPLDVLLTHRRARQQRNIPCV
ncbi:hypothetical protein LGM75_18100 [Burkholderia multivorans]|uniref:hypothetical protein n=1 Tax=Burkholderia multivorans TaxID=87883 RepID=UPI00143EDE20|nr:hypothetical protein [Burkholderia multivorans]MBU9222311.1 hypothetical protein [Burkholderia multivorans]MBU9417628.1 hypothetical protein [Burkholderia multivorans]MBU9469254.1 hypothetical protein [Burkholderia multivorans]MBU9476873.1 hypothetical protein [Burkholderia multivorans]MCA8128265.1 hypothetical protein [Burkholderia multivorans]